MECESEHRFKSSPPSGGLLCQVAILWSDVRITAQFLIYTKNHWKKAIAHNNGFVLSAEFDNVLHSLERSIRKNLTSIRLDVTDLDIRLVATEKISTAAERAADNSKLGVLRIPGYPMRLLFF